MNETEKAWLAGFIDGEGSIGLTKEYDQRKGVGYFHYRPALQISNTVKSALDDAQEMIGGGYISLLYRDKRGNRKPLYMYALRKQEILKQTLQSIIPYLRIKRKHAELLVAYIHRRQDIRKNAKGWYAPYVTEDEITYAILKEMNRRGVTSPAEEM